MIMLSMRLRLKRNETERGRRRSLYARSKPRVILKTNDVVIMDKHLVRLAAPPKDSRPGKLQIINVLHD